jgi:type I restriction enzyme S subunit
MKGWEEYTLRDLVDLKQGFALNKKSDHYLSRDSSGLPLLKISDLINGIETLFVKENIPKQFLVYPHEIIYSRTGQVGLAFMGKTGVVYNNCFKVIPNEKVYSVFLFHWLNNPKIRERIQSLATGAAQPDLNHDAFKSVKIILPPLLTQRKIASILSAYDDLIENNLKRIKLLEEIAQRTYEEWFIKFRINGKQLKLNKETGLPEGWEKKRTDEFCKFSNGYAYYTKGYSENGYIVLDLGNVAENSDLKISGKEKFISEELYEATKKFHLSKYDVIMAMTDVTSALRILGKTAIVDEDNKYALNQRVGCLRSKDSKIDYSIIYALFNDIRFLEKMKAVSKGAVQFYFNTKDVVEYEHIIPTSDFIDLFRITYKPLLEMRMNLKDQNKKLKESRDILLPRLMSGVIEV